MSSNLPFSDKYRPRKIEDLILDDIISKKMRNIILNKDVPNIIFTGKSGAGKTSTIHVIAKLIYPKNSREMVIELNASDDRGIKSVHETIFNFCKRKVEFGEGYAQHKLIILDEADNITPKAQKLINSIMEKYPTTRFAFTCNNSSAVIESIQSRCVIVRFTNPPTEKFIDRIKAICVNESIEYDIEGLNYLFGICQKDLRKTLNMLELVFRAKNTITKINIMEISDIPCEETLGQLLKSIENKDVQNICKIVNEFESQGYFSLDILLHFIQYNKRHNQIKEESRINLINILSNKSYIMSKSSPSYLQLTGAILACI
jgi:DNA polymerase III delta prime subunit